ncbi:MAG: glycosyltransferase family 2 protein [bacterium]
MKILTVISNFNEEKAIKETILDVVNNASIKTDILIIDNSSSDNSLKAIKESNIDYLAHPVNTGGSAGVIKTAFVYANYHNYDIYCHMDGDNQHCASELENLIQPIINNDKDIVIGSRFIKRKGFQSSFLRRIGISIFSYILTKITKNRLTDITSGFRAYNKNAIEFFSKKFKHEIEASVQLPLVASFAGLKIMEVPVIMKPRITGKSEINFINAIKFPVYATISLIGTLLQKK